MKSSKAGREAAFAERAPLTALGIVLGLFFGGGALGLWVAGQLAPSSPLASLLSFLALPAAFMLGFVLWAGASLPAAWRRLRALRRAKAGGVSVDLPPITVPPGSFAFVPAGLVLNSAVGLLVGMLSSNASFLATWALYALIGAAYGFVCWRLAKRGRLAFPNE